MRLERKKACLSHRTRTKPFVRGFFIVEMIVGLGLLAVAAFVLVIATSRVHLASSRMADSRAATRAAEAALCELEAGQPLSASDAEATIRVTAAAGANEGESWQWIEVTATVGGQSRTLTGPVPRGPAQTAPSNGGTP
jgi:Tfp pilus assembly protein PilX